MYPLFWEGLEDLFLVGTIQKVGSFLGGGRPAIVQKQKKQIILSLGESGVKNAAYVSENTFKMVSVGNLSRETASWEGECVWEGEQCGRG